ncbi:MAG TPA: bacillithiol biosynthesis deacetylase BshB1 [Gemmatimonadaceae bacterium]|nr:bacillithiol biosynthesis deacetylase BshB1 [Gemmatimonadaceae bacterium]
MPTLPSPPALDLLAIFPHPDDAELTSGGTLLKATKRGRTAGILDLSAGEMASRGTPERRASEAARAAAILGVRHRENLCLPDTGIVNAPETRRLVALAIRRLRPRIVITTAPSPFGRHPDHRETAELVRDACFVAGLRRLDPDTPPHRPLKVLHSITYREDYLKPTFVVDISEELEPKLEAVACYASQFEGVTQAGEVYPNGESLLDIIRHQAAHYGSLIRTRYGEPFHTTETMRVDDVVALEVSTF